MDVILDELCQSKSIGSDVCACAGQECLQTHSDIAISKPYPSGFLKIGVSTCPYHIASVVLASWVKTVVPWMLHLSPFSGPHYPILINNCLMTIRWWMWDLLKPWSHVLYGDEWHRPTISAVSHIEGTLSSFLNWDACVREYILKDDLDSGVSFLSLHESKRSCACVHLLEAYVSLNINL